MPEIDRGVVTITVGLTSLAWRLAEKKHQEELHRWHTVQQDERFSLLVKTISDISTRRSTAHDYAATDEMFVPFDS